jgi:hypothetical protein
MSDRSKQVSPPPVRITMFDASGNMRGEWLRWFQGLFSSTRQIDTLGTAAFVDVGAFDATGAAAAAQAASLQKSANLSDVANGSASRANLGAAGLSGSNTFTGPNTFSALGFALMAQVAGQAAIDMWNTTTGGTRWRIFADKVGGGGGLLTFGFYDITNARFGAGIDNNGVLCAPNGLNVGTPANVTLGSGWLSWTPTVTASGAMTVSALTVTDAQYLRIGPLVMFKVFVVCTLGGTASNQMLVTVPVTTAGQNSVITASINVGGGANWFAAWGYTDTSDNQFHVLQTGGGNYTLGSTSLLLEGFYRC